MPDDTAEELPPPTAPESISVTVRGWGDEESAPRLAHFVAEVAREFSRCIDLANLDGLTLAGDYAQALAELDRGYETSFVLTPSDDIAIGVAMTPSVIRDGHLKSHIVLNANLAAAMMDQDHELHRTSIHTLAHEAAHVEITAAFDRCFPNVLLRARRANLHDHCRWEVILACWDEYAATRISATFGEDPTDGYEQTFITSLAETRESANRLIRAYRRHGDHGRIMGEVYGEYGRLMKYAAYHLGNLDGHGIDLQARARTIGAMEGHWFTPYLERLQAGLRDLWSEFGRWSSTQPFEAIGDIADDMVREGGVRVSNEGEGRVRIDVPFTPDTI